MERTGAAEKRFCVKMVVLGLLMAMALTFTAMAAVTERTLGEPEWIRWDGTTAVWDSVSKASQYQVKLYEDEEDSEVIVKLTVDTNRADLGSYMENGVDYYVSVRAVAKMSQSGYVTDGQWVDSPVLQGVDRGYTGGKWRNYQAGNRYETETGAYLGAGWQRVEGSWYYMDQNGYTRSGWLPLEDATYYLSENGSMMTGWQELDGSWYYFQEDGAMKTGWLMTQPGQWYYFDETGKMLSNTEVDGYSLNETGLWVQE
ncbi:MAG: hypothetical protein ACLTKI_05915 [Lachnospiraceae bacterium]